MVPVLEQFTRHIAKEIEKEFGVRCIVDSKDSKNAAYMVCKHKDKDIFFHNITEALLPYSDGVHNCIRANIKKWIKGEYEKVPPINMYDTVVTIMLNFILSKAELNKKLPKRVVRDIMRRLKIAINKNPKNVEYILQGFQAYLSDIVETNKHPKAKHPTHFLVIKGDRKADDKRYNIWHIAKEQGIDSYDAVPSEVIVTKSKNYKHLQEAAEAHGIKELSLVYLLMIVNRFGSYEYAIRRHDQYIAKKKYEKDIKTPASAESIASLANVFG